MFHKYYSGDASVDFGASSIFYRLHPTRVTLESFNWHCDFLVIFKFYLFTSVVIRQEIRGNLRKKKGGKSFSSSAFKIVTM